VFVSTSASNFSFPRGALVYPREGLTDGSPLVEELAERKERIAVVDALPHLARSEGSAWRALGRTRLLRRRGAW
jgi:hypothetical protein